jgi:hypothetical protein
VHENSPGAEAHTRLLAWNDSRLVLLEHRVDAVVTGLPFPVDQLRVTSSTTSRGCSSCRGTTLWPARKSVAFDEIADEPIPHIRRSDPRLNACWRFDLRSGGWPAPEDRWS